uniref:cytochrome c oxidase subunit III n=1 Tax=Parasacculina yatsui TaxID=2836420 RepID=UPI002551E742|nr:cytochrome c oxidase subunit III [Parasacculina yatsui]WGU20848.1 cytochrome c oxidase subunit III [Parasacculina yatsui]
MNIRNINSFHLLSPSPWPICMSLSTMCTMLMIIYLMCFGFFSYMFYFNILIFFLNLVNWFTDVHIESSLCGDHCTDVVLNLSLGYVFFIVSEIFLFISFFWSFFHMSLVSDVELGCMWPPIGLDLLDYTGIPLLNTVILLSSGFVLTWSHYNLLVNNFLSSFYALIFTIILGLYFIFIQLYEYYSSNFNISDSVFGSLFFFITGFHGLHVIVGIIFLLVCTIRFYSSFMSIGHHKNFEYSAWYWHFVDVVWLFLYMFMYIWSFNI